MFSLTAWITWLKQTFTEADKNGDGSLSISEVLQLLHKLNVNLPRQKVKQMFKVKHIYGGMNCVCICVYKAIAHPSLIVDLVHCFVRVFLLETHLDLIESCD